MECEKTYRSIFLAYKMKRMVGIRQNTVEGSSDWNHRWQKATWPLTNLKVGVIKRVSLPEAWAHPGCRSLLADSNCDIPCFVIKSQSTRSLSIPMSPVHHFLPSHRHLRLPLTALAFNPAFLYCYTVSFRKYLKHIPARQYGFYRTNVWNLKLYQPRLGLTNLIFCLDPSETISFGELTNDDMNITFGSTLSLLNYDVLWHSYNISYNLFILQYQYNCLFASLIWIIFIMLTYIH